MNDFFEFLGFQEAFEKDKDFWENKTCCMCKNYESCTKHIMLMGTESLCLMFVKK